MKIYSLRDIFIGLAALPFLFLIVVIALGFMLYHVCSNKILYGYWWEPL